MIDASLGKQLMITVNNKVGTMAEVAGVVASSGINLIAVCANAVDNVGSINFISEDDDQAKSLLQAKGYDVREEEIILLTLDNKPGTLQDVCQKIAAAGIDITLIYGSVSAQESESRLVLVTENNNLVLATLKMIE